MAAASASTKQNVAVFVRQIRSWDCGLACLGMVLASREAAFVPVRPGGQLPSLVRPANPQGLCEELHRVAATTSTWTVDLAFVLWRAGVPFSLRSACLAVSHGLEDMSFYSGYVDSDRPRVERRIRLLRDAAAATPGLALVKEASTEIDALRKAVQEQESWLIVLCDGRRLPSRAFAVETTARRIVSAAVRALGTVSADRDISSRVPRPGASSLSTTGAGAAVETSSASKARESSPSPAWYEELDSTGFLGHYIVVVAWENDSRTGVKILDPADSGAQIRSMSEHQFEVARLARGTDEDVIIVPMTSATIKASAEPGDVSHSL